MKIFIVPAILLFLFSCTNKSVFYIDAENGNDGNSGNSPESAWQSLEKVNQMVFEAGDKILFKAGNSWDGQLEPKGSGAMDSPIQMK